jgi:hypothetical protein
MDPRWLPGGMTEKYIIPDIFWGSTFLIFLAKNISSQLAGITAGGIKTG